MPSSLSGEIKEQALNLGFSAVRIASVEPAQHAAEFRAWIEAGYHADMDWMAREPERRSDPRMVMPAAQSAVVVAMLQPRGEAAPISRYARAEDYHKAMWKRLNQLLYFVKSREPNAVGRGCVDTAPILERDLAASCGLGWIGKNTCLITPGVGSFLFIGELLLSIPLDPDPPMESHCGKCRRCLDACPTGALVAPHVLDARRCISYLTIELKGSIPVEMRPLIGTRIFGCDTCQDACPHNMWSGTHRPYRVRTDLQAPDLIEILSLDETRFRARFGGTPIMRAKRRGLLRNVCVALGNAGDEAAIPALMAAISDPEPLIREHAAWALDRLLDVES